MFPTIPPTKATGLGLPSAPTLNTQGPPFQYGHPGPVGSQYYAAGMGVGAPQLYYGAPPYCYVTVGTFARRGLSSTAKTLRSLSGVSRF